MPRTKRKASANAGLVREVASPDGSIAFALKRASTGVHVERTQQLAEGSRVMHSTLILSIEEFQRLCDSDPLRFEHPHTFFLATKACHELFDDMG